MDERGLRNPVFLNFTERDIFNNHRELADPAYLHRTVADPSRSERYHNVSASSPIDQALLATGQTGGQYQDPISIQEMERRFGNESLLPQLAPTFPRAALPSMVTFASPLANPFSEVNRSRFSISHQPPYTNQRSSTSWNPCRTY